MPSEQLAYSIKDAIRLSTLGKTSLYKAAKEGGLRLTKKGRRTVILAEDLKAFLEQVGAT